MVLSQAVMLLGCYRQGAVVRLLHAELVSKPPSAWQQLWLWQGFGMGPSILLGCEIRLGALFPLLCFSSQPSTEQGWPCGQAAASMGALQRWVCAEQCGSGQL